MKFESLLFPGPTGVSDDALLRHALSMSKRLLSGSGSASLLAFRELPQRELAPLAHGIAADGTLVVALHLAESDATAWGSTGVDVRLDIVKDAPDASLQIRAASLHALARLDLVGPELAEAWIEAGALPELLADAAAAGSQLSLATLELGTVLLHGPSGVTKILVEDLLGLGEDPVFPTGGDEFACAEVAAGLPKAAWLEVVESVLTGHLEGVELGRQMIPPACPHVLGSVRVVDVDATGATLIHFTSLEATTVFVPFPTPVADPATLRTALRELLPLGWMPGQLPTLRC